MSYSAASDIGVPRQQTQAETEIVQRAVRLFGQLQVDRTMFAGQWEEIAALIAPNYRGTFFHGEGYYPGAKKADRQVDATGMLALSRFAAICDSLLTPRNQLWHGLEASDPYLNKQRRVKLWFESARDALFRARYAPHANFVSQNQAYFQSLGAFGTASMFVDEFSGQDGEKGLRYRALPIGEVYLMQNHQGLVDGYVRAFRLNARQIKQQWPDTFPPMLQPALDQDSQQMYYLLQMVEPNEGYTRGKFGVQGKRFRSCYVFLDGQHLLSEGGYRTFPLPTGRYEQGPNETYGRGPAGMVLPGLKTLNAEKRVFLKQGHRAADPVLLTHDDGMMSLDLQPGAMNPGGVNSDGRALVQVLPSGNIQITKEMMQDEKAIINDAFLVTLFQILTETPQMTATEVIERTNEKGILLGPTVGRQQAEYVGPLVTRELDILVSLHMLEPMPPELVEAKGAYEIVNTSPLARAMRAQEAAGFFRTVEGVKELVNITGDPSLLDPFDFDTAIPAIADIQGVPVSWMADENQVLTKRQNRAQAQQQQQQIQAAPAQAAMMKAQAAQAKAGMGAPPGAEAPPPQ